MSRPITNEILRVTAHYLQYQYPIRAFSHRRPHHDTFTSRMPIHRLTADYQLSFSKSKRPAGAGLGSARSLPLASLTGLPLSYLNGSTFLIDARVTLCIRGFIPNKILVTLIRLTTKSYTAYVTRIVTPLIARYLTPMLASHGTT